MSYATQEIAVFSLIALSAYISISSVRKYLHFWKQETQKMQEVGYLAPKPGKIETAVTRIIFRVKGYIECCKITIIGRERLPQGRIILAGNHIDIGDTDVISAIVGRKAGRFLIALAELPPAKPESIIMAMAGAIPVNQHSKRAKLAVIDTAADALVADGPASMLAIFPQGQLDPSEEISLESFKRGTAEIARRAAQQLDSSETLWIVPFGIHYKNDEQKVPVLNSLLKHVMNKHMPRRHDNTPFFSVAKYEAIAVIGTPIPVSLEGSKSELTTQLIHRAIKDAHTRALTRV